ncbi:SAF domain-containing protein [Lachnospiraceae bacterium 47-T17]
MEQMNKSLAHYEKLQEQYSYMSVFVLTEDVTAGEELTASSFQERRVQSTEDLSLAEPLTAEELLGKRVKISLAKGTPLGSDVVYEGEAVADDERQVELRELYLPGTLRENEFVDLRIVFPNGEDYLVVKRKRVYRLIRDEEGEVLAVGLRFLEEELLRYQAAVVDARTYENTRLYALQYTGDFQAAATEYYPVNPAVFALLCWDPNITELFVVDAEQERREILESHLEQFLADEPQTANAAAQTDLTGGEMPLPDASETKEPLTLYTGLPEEP